MTYTFNKEKVINQLKEMGYSDPENTIDWLSYSNDISISEWLENEYNIKLTSLKDQVENIKAIQEKEKYENQKRIKDQEKELLKEWYNQKAETINIKSFEIPQHYINMACLGFSTGCFLVGEGGIGKSYLSIETIKKHKRDYAYLNTSVSPLALYKFIYKNKDKLILFDDVEGIFTDSKSISILKSALWQVNNKRVLCWETTSDKIGDTPEIFEFTGQIIILSNKINIKDANLSALISRVNFQEVNFQYEEKIKIMKSIIKKDYKCLSYQEREHILNHIINNTDETNKHFNFRTLIKAYDFFLYNRDKFTILLNSILEKDQELELIKLLESKDLSVKEKVNKWIELTGKSRRSYFNKKKMIQCKSATQNQYSF